MHGFGWTALRKASYMWTHADSALENCVPAASQLLFTVTAVTAVLSLYVS